MWYSTALTETTFWSKWLLYVCFKGSLDQVNGDKLKSLLLSESESRVAIGHLIYLL